jgi:hypothetical protein
MTDPTVPDALDRLRHDLGKAIVRQVTWLGPDPDPEALREALAADLLATRRSASGAVGAVALFDRLLPGLGTLPRDEDWRRLDDAMQEIRTIAGALERGTANDDDVARGVRAARAVADACRALHRKHARG